MSEIAYWWEDMTPGRRFDLGSKTVTADEIVEFAQEFDPQPFHLSVEAGEASILGGLSASGWHSCAMFMRLYYDNLLHFSSSEGSPGVDFVEWRKPVLAGDTLTGVAEVLETRPLKSRPGIGLVKLRHEVRNQRGELVMAMENPGLFRMRAGAAA
ncbi:acyl dehydratase [Rhizobium sp. SG_E_25_P2]|uniref:MaoC family dehydratase n=1 Tax=Rhizobium sp. SG_E_25_P2 TaxID=2879942 RepID=UPI0024732EA0|nr:MaoC family dehydratase [Rhizobium sp. SG_E_25_P2]MDH6266988.1 acyl dehydratase [Rhizobium sp. SG_E_25_P2]